MGKDPRLVARLVTPRQLSPGYSTRAVVFLPDGGGAGRARGSLVSIPRRANARFPGALQSPSLLTPKGSYPIAQGKRSAALGIRSGASQDPEDTRGPITAADRTNNPLGQRPISGPGSVPDGWRWWATSVS